MIIGDMEIRLRADIARLQRDMDQARQVVSTTASGIGRAADQMKAALAAVGLGAGLAQIIQMSDQYTKFTAQLKLATTSQREYAQALEDVKRISTDAQSSLAGAGTLYARIANGTRELGVSQQQVANITETVSLALKVSGATAEESASAMLQLSQSFASGALRGEEFNAVNEAAPRLMKALADGMGVPVGALKDMASNGLITSKIMADVLPGALEKLRDESKEIQTISGAFQVLKDRVMEFTAVHAEANGTVALLTTGIDLLANNFAALMGVTTTLTAAKLGASLSAWTVKTYEQIAAAAALRAANIALLESELASSGAKVTQLTATEAAIVAERQLVVAKLAAARANIVSAEAAISAASAAGAQSFALRTLQLATTELAVAETQRAAMMAELAILGRQQASVSTQLAAAKTAEAAAQLGLNAATSAGAAAAGLATRALGFLGGPVGALITVLGLAAVAWSHWGGTAKEASESAKGATEDSFATIIKGLDAQIEKHEALIRLRKQGMSLDAAQKVDQKPLNELGSLSSQLNALNAGTGLPSGSSKEDYFFKRQEVLQKILELNTKINKEQTTGAEATSLTQAEARAKFMTDYATKAEQLAAKLAEARKLLGSAFTPDDEARIRKAYAVTDQSAKQEQTAYKNLMTSIQEKIAANRLEMSGYNQLSESQKLTIALDAEIATGKSKLSARDIENARSQIAVVSATDAVVASNKRAKAGAEEYTKMVKAHDDQVAKSIQSANDEAAKNEELVVTFGMSKAAIEQLELSRLQDQLAQRAATGLTLDEIAALEKLIDAKKRNVTAVTRVEDMTTAQKSAEELAQFLDPTRAQDFGDALKGAFNGAGDAISKMTKVLDDFGRKSAQIEKQRGNAANAYLNGLTDEKTYLSELSQISRKDTQERLGGYGDMTSAAAGFFGEQSKGYKVLTTVSQVFHAAELAMTLAELVPKGISAVLSQGQGDPYSAFARMAAMAAIVTGLGVAISGGGGGGGGQSAADVQKAQGTGSVFGDSSAKSDSIRRSIEQMTANSSDMLPINQGMLTALQNIESSMTGLTNLVVRTTGLTDGANMGIQTGTIATGGPVALAGSAQVGSMIGGALAGPLGVWIGGAIGGAVSKLWGKTTQNIVDSGLQYGGSVRSLQAGHGFDQYASIDTTKSSFFGLSKSTSNRVEVQGLNDELSKQFGLIFTNLDKSLQAAATAMGGSTADVTKVLDNLTLESTKVSLKGLTGTALTDALNSVISKSMDEIAEAAFPQLDQFRKVGEGYAETVMRLAGDYAKLDSILAASSTTFGATGMASIAARERLIELAGGIDQLATQTNSFTQNFLSKAEQLAPVQKYVTDQLAAMGLQSLDTRDKFKDYVLGLANSGALATEAGAEQYTALLALADAFAKTHAVTVDLTKSEQEIADERTDLRNKLDELTMTQAQLADKARAAIDAHNLALYDEVIAAQAARDAAKELLDGVSTAYANLQTVVNAQKDVLNTAYQTAADGLQASIDSMTASVSNLQSLSDSLHSTLDSMTVPGQEKSDRQAAQAQIAAALAIAKAGGTLPATDSLKGALATVAKDASGQFSSYLDYQRDLYRTKNNVAGLAGYTDTELSTEQLTLKAIQGQKTALDEAHKQDLAALDRILEQAKAAADILNGIATSLMTLPQALAELAAAVAAVKGNPIAAALSQAAAAYQQYLGRSATSSETDFWQSQAANGVDIVGAIKGSDEAKIQGLYQSLLGRKGDAAGVDVWEAALKNGMTWDQVKQGFLGSDEYKKLHPFAVGTNSVPRDMPAFIHKDERIIPAADNRELMARLRDPAGDTSALVSEIRALRTEVASLRSAAERTATSSEEGTGLLKRVIRNDVIVTKEKV